jgi:hypothetical protein
VQARHGGSRYPGKHGCVCGQRPPPDRQRLRKPDSIRKRLLISLHILFIVAPGVNVLNCRRPFVSAAGACLRVLELGRPLSA